MVGIKPVPEDLVVKIYFKLGYRNLSEPRSETFN